MRLNTKKGLVSVMTVAVLLGGVITSNASVTTFNSKVFINKDEWTRVTYSTKENTSVKESIVYMTEMFDSKKKVASNYKKLKVRAGNSSSSNTYSYASESIAVKGTASVLRLNASAKKGVKVYLYGKGNNPDLDCYITGWYNAN